MSQQTYQQIRAVVESDFLAVDSFIVAQLHSNVPLVENIGHYIVAAGGKRLRPILVLLAARACDIKSDQQIPLAAVIEFIHTATLLPDDVVDGSDLRRGKAAANIVYGNPATVLVGAFLFTRAFELMVEDGSLKVHSRPQARGGVVMLI